LRHERTKAGTKVFLMTDIAQQVREDVYNVEETAESTFRIENDILHAKVEDEDAIWRVDDIANGEVALVGFRETDDLKATGYVRFDADEAERLGEALLAASDYARGQE